MEQLKYPIGIQTFSKIREGGFVYVDKTDYIRKLVEKSQYVFLSRPRRFGKSLFLSTLHEFFAGRRELFAGLAVDKMEWDWAKHPVLHLDFTGTDYSKPGSLESTLSNQFNIWEREYGLEQSDLQISDRFPNIIRRSAEMTGQRVVILIDEYDKPLLETVDNPELQDRLRNTLRGVYGNLKKMDQYIRFAMLTGVTKFGHLSIFSDLNNLDDISMTKTYAGICGITTDELHENFHEGVKALAQEEEISVDEAYEELRKNYVGYHFSAKGSPDIYNPFSVLNALSKGEIRDYWFRTGTPTFLVKLIKSRQIHLQEINDVQIKQSEVESVNIDMVSSLYPVLYQSGYLTIKDYDGRTERLTLCFPNREVTEGFLEQLYMAYLKPGKATTEFDIAKFYRDMDSGNAEQFMERLQSLFADFPYDSFDLKALEQHYQDITYLVMKLMGFITEVEYKTASGRIDMVVKTDRYIYVFEFKMDRSAQEALAQIGTKQYLLPFKADGRQLVKIGANFSSQLRGIDEWEIVEE